MITSLKDYFFNAHKDTNKVHNAIILVRIIVGTVFMSEGIQKFLYPDALGIGRFIKIGIPAPFIMAPFVGVVEIVCGAFILFGLYSRLASIPLIINMLVSIATTKIPFFIEKGFWAAAHESRVDWSMILGSIFILIAGSGRWSLDDLRVRSAKERNI